MATSRTIKAVPDPRAQEFESDEVARSSVKITKAGDGLSDALKIDPVVMHRGDEVYVVLKCEVRYVAFPPEKKGSSRVVRQHVLDTTDIMLTDEKSVGKMLAENRDRVQRALDSIAGQMRIHDDDDDEDEDDE